MGDTVTVTLTREQARALLPEVKTQPRTKGVNARTARAKIREALDFPEDQPNCGGSGRHEVAPGFHPDHALPCKGCNHPECPVQAEPECLNQQRAELVKAVQQPAGYTCSCSKRRTASWSPWHCGCCGGDLKPECPVGEKGGTDALDVIRLLVAGGVEDSRLPDPDCTHLFEQGLLKHVAVGQSGEYEAVLTPAGYAAIGEFVLGEDGWDPALYPPAPTTKDGE